MAVSLLFQVWVLGEGTERKGLGFLSPKPRSPQQTQVPPGVVEQTQG